MVKKEFAGLVKHIRPATAFEPWDGPRRFGPAGKYPPAKPGALGCEPLKAATGSLTRPQYLLAA